MNNIKILFTIMLFALLACSESTELGSKNNPVKMYFVPWTEAGKIITDSQKLKDYLTEETGYHFQVGVPTSYAAVVEGLGTAEVDIAWLPPFAYLLAHEKYGAEVALTPIRNGINKYRGEFLAHVDSDIDSLADIEGKIIAYTDAASTSGYIYPSATLAKRGIEPGDVYIAGGHTQAIVAVYQGRADVGCAYWSPPTEEGPQDGRKELLGTYPDVFEKVKIIGFTDWILNDTVTFRKNFPEAMKEKIIQALFDYLETEEGETVMDKLYAIDGYVRAKDSDYDSVRETLETLGVSPEKYIE